MRQNIEMPKDMTRPETGVMQFGDDWPGVFIRGDNAFAYSLSLSRLLDSVDESDFAKKLDKMKLIGLLELLKSSHTPF